MSDEESRPLFMRVLPEHLANTAARQIFSKATVCLHSEDGEGWHLPTDTAEAILACSSE